MRRIPLRRRDGTVRDWAIVDDADYDDVMAYGRWHWHEGYAAIKIRIRRKKATIFMHWVVMPGDQRCDHINRNRLDNRRSNLRPATQAQNLQNQDVRRNNTSGFRGVSYERKKDKWEARVTLDGHRYFLGRYNTAKEADQTVKRFRRDHSPFSEDARL